MNAPTILALSAVLVQLAGATLYLHRVARGRLERPVELYVAVPLGVVLAVLALALGRGAPTPAALALLTVSGALGAIAFVMHALGRVPTNAIRVAVGEPLPAFTALDSEGGVFDSSSLEGRRVLLKFYRGEWCPFCQAELRAFEAMRPRLVERGVQLIALSKDTPEAARAHALRDQLGFPLLCDPELRVIRRFGLEHRKALEISSGPRASLFGLTLGSSPRFRAMAAPTTLLVDEAGTIRWLDTTDDYKVRSSVQRVLGAIDRAFGGRVEPERAPAIDEPECVAC